MHAKPPTALRDWDCKDTLWIEFRALLRRA
jgi:hypothetical protein